MLRVRTTCSRCDGTGTVTTEREKRLDELSSLQKELLFEADLHRETPSEETEERIEEMERKANAATQQAPSPRGHGQSVPATSGPDEPPHINQRPPPQ